MAEIKLEFKKIKENQTELAHTQVLLKRHVLGYFIKNNSNAGAQFEHWNFVSKTYYPNFYTKTRKKMISTLEDMYNNKPIKLNQCFGQIKYHNIEIYDEALYLRVDSFWYFDDVIAEIRINDKRFILESRGEQRVFFDEGLVYTGTQAVRYALDNNLKDEELSNLDWDMNNWLAVIEINNIGDCISDDLAICGDYHEGMEALIECALENN